MHEDAVCGQQSAQESPLEGATSRSKAMRSIETGACSKTEPEAPTGPEGAGESSGTERTEGAGASGGASAKRRRRGGARQDDEMTLTRHEIMRARGMC